MQEHTVQEVFDMSAEARLPFAPVSNIADLVASPHLNARGFFVKMRHPVLPGSSKYPAPRTSFPETPWELRTPAAAARPTQR